MKNRILHLQVLLIGLLLISNPLYSQSKFDLSGGFGYPELFNLRVNYGQNIEIGACVGFFTFEWFGDNVVDWSCAVEISYHFSGKSKYVEQATWYFLGGLGYYNLPVVNHYEEYDIAFYPRIGRTLNFSKKAGMKIDLGIFLPLSKDPDFETFDFRVLLSGGIGLFIRL
jgi:hypothetical protein